MFKNTVGPSKLYDVLYVAVACSVGDKQGKAVVQCGCVCVIG